MRPHLSDDPELAEIRFALYLHQATAHGFTSSCDVCVSTYAAEERYYNEHPERFRIVRTSAA